jgi:hypothetical protein
LNRRKKRDRYQGIEKEEVRTVLVFNRGELRKRYYHAYSSTLNMDD